MRHRCIRAWIAVAATLAVSGCAGTAPRKDSDVRVGLYGNPSSFSLIGNTDLNSMQLASVISDGLVGYDAQGHYVPMVARSWELAPDGKTLTFHLREGVLWQDGRPLTSKDVAYTVTKIRDPAVQATSWVSSFANVASVETPDDLTVVVHFSGVYADFLEPWRAPLVPEHVASKDASFLGGAFAHHPIGCGPFRFVSFSPGQNVVLEAFDKYWGGRPKMDRMMVKIITAERTGYESLLLGELDMLGLTPDLWRESLTAPAAKRFERFVYYRLTGWRADWNQYESTPFFRDKRVRRAMLLALDRKRFADTVCAGVARPGVSSYPPESLWADPSIEPIPFDPVESERLLDAAGWRKPASGGVRAKNGRPFEFTLIFAAGAQELADRIAAWMQQSLADVGVRMKIEKIAPDVFRLRRKTHAFDAAIATVQFDATPDRFDLYHSKARDGGYNFGGFSDTEVDRLLDQGRATVDPAARREIYNTLQKRLDDLQPMSFLFQFAAPTLRDPDLEGVVSSPVGLYSFAPGPRAWHWSSQHARR
jgi:peptide/nickel transport system substrate-binding protein